MMMMMIVMLELVRTWILFVDRFDDDCDDDYDYDCHNIAKKKDYIY